MQKNIYIQTVGFFIGRHCCLWCHITANGMNTPQGESKLHSLETMKDDLKRFKENGSNPKHAKHFNNMIDDIYFDIPLEQVKIK